MYITFCKYDFLIAVLQLLREICTETPSNIWLVTLDEHYTVYKMHFDGVPSITSI